MKTLLVIISLTLLLTNCRSFHSLNSLTTVPPGKDFELGNNRHGSFAAQVQNVGPVPVTISQQRSDGQFIQIGLFQPGERQNLKLAAGSSIVFANASTQPAQLKLVVTGDTNLSMKYINGK